MATNIKILIVEDTENDIQSYKDTIRTLNMDLSPDLEIVAIYAKSKDEGLEQINNLKDNLDGAFIDLKLQSGTTVDVSEGNDLIKEIYGKLRFPIIVLTNTPGAFNGDFKKSLFLQLKTKTDILYRDVIMSLIDIHKTGITKILGRKGLVEKMLDGIFWKNISSTLPEWIGVANCEKPLLRYTLTLLQEHLEISDDGSEFDIVYPMENYIQPSIKDYFFTGDIIYKRDEKSKRFIILTPACDLAPHGEDKIPKTKEVLLAEIQSFNDGVIKQKVTVAKKISSAQTATEIANAKEDIKKILSNNYSPKYYYLPDTSFIKGGLVNFQKLTSVKLSEVKLVYEKEATITIQFVKDIISKFSYYYSRQGSPDFDFDGLLTAHLT